MNICADIFKTLEAGPTLLERVITCDDSWFFTYDRKKNNNQCIGRAPIRKGKSWDEIQSHDDYVFLQKCFVKKI